MVPSRILPSLAALLCAATLVFAQTKPRARDLGVPFDGTPGANNAITDVQGVEVGHTTLISGSGKLKVGEGPVRTGVTAIHPRGKEGNDSVFGAWFTLNGNGEMTGTTWLEDSGFLDGPIMITNTHSVGVVRDAVIAWKVKRGEPDMEGYWWSLPVVAETWDGFLNDINGFHVKPEHVFHALDSAHRGPVEEGNVGGGTGMICNEFKGGIGTASRVLDAKAGGYTVGVLVQCNYGRRSELRIAGVPVGKEIPEHPVRRRRRIDHHRRRHRRAAHPNATEAPGPTRVSRPRPRRQLLRRRFRRHLRSLLHRKSRSRIPKGVRDLKMLPNDSLDPYF
jgi:D-aminopeptidase